MRWMALVLGGCAAGLAPPAFPAMLAAAQLAPAARLTNVYPPSAGERALAPAHLLAFADAIGRRFTLSVLEYDGQRRPVLAWSGTIAGADRIADVERALTALGLSRDGDTRWCGPAAAVQECVQWRADSTNVFLDWLFVDDKPAHALSLASLRAALPHLAMNAELDAILTPLGDLPVEQLGSSLVGFTVVFVSQDPAALERRLTAILRANGLVAEGTAAPVLDGQGVSFGREGTNLRGWIVLSRRSETTSSVEPGVRVGLKIFRK